MNGSEPPRVQLCYSYYKKGGIVNNTYVFDPNVVDGEFQIIHCVNLLRLMRPASKGIGHVALSHSFMYQYHLTNGSKCCCRSIKCAQMSPSLQVYCVCL